MCPSKTHVPMQVLGMVASGLQVTLAISSLLSLFADHSCGVLMQPRMQTEQH